MKKLLLQTIFLLIIVLGNNLFAQAPQIAALSQNLCMGSRAYAAVNPTVPSATNYSWTISSGSVVASHTPASNGLSTIIQYPSTCGVYTIVCAAYAGTAFITNLTTTVSVACNSASTLGIASSSSGSLCSGSTATLSGGGNTTYTWIPGNLTGANVVVAPTSNVCYTLLAQNAAGCFNMSASYCMSVIPTFSLGVSGNTAVCAGNSTTLSLTGGTSFVTFPGNINSSNPVLTPSVTTGYTLWCPSNTYACPSTSVVTVFVNPLPNVSISGPSGPVCAGITSTLVGNGAVTYTWSVGALGNSILVNPTSNTCFSVIAHGANGCMNAAAYCYSVLPLPNVFVNGRGNLCHGSSFTFTATGANSYTWNTNPVVNTATYNVLPLSTTYYTVSGTGTNNCIGMDTAVVHVTTLCAIVWPGDANRDGLVSTLDVLELGLAAGSTGAARSNTSNAWSGQFASAWTGTISTGWNKVHADCNGDGIVNTNDNAAITANFALTHGFKGTEVSANPDIALIPQQSFASEGLWNKIDVVLGSASNSISQLYGLAFDINYDESKIHADSVKMIYTNSFLNANNQNIDFSKANFNNGKLYCASVRVDHANTSGNGKIAEFWFKVKTGLGAEASINISTSNAQKVSSSGILSNLTSDAGISQTISNNLTGGIEQSMFSSLVNFHPNPAHQILNLKSRLNETVLFTIQDIIGREILNGEFKNSHSMDISNLSAGTYFIHFNAGKVKITKKLIIEE